MIAVAPENLPDVIDRAFADISQARESFTTSCRVVAGDLKPSYAQF